jgi:hypothetical protein
LSPVDDVECFLSGCFLCWIAETGGVAKVAPQVCFCFCVCFCFSPYRSLRGGHPSAFKILFLTTHDQTRVQPQKSQKSKESSIQVFQSDKTRWCGLRPESTRYIRHPKLGGPRSLGCAWTRAVLRMLVVTVCVCIRQVV